MSSSSQDKNTKGLEELMRELRQSTSLYSSIFRVVTTRMGMPITDMQVLDLLDLIGPLTAGQLAELTGLTTGAITRILDRLEKAGLVRRERDKSDGRKIIVRLRGKDDMQQVRSTLSSVGKAWDEAASRYDEEQIAFLLDFLQYSNTVARQELLQLQQEAPTEEEEIFSAPLAGESGRLVIYSGGLRLNLSAADLKARLYQARFEGLVPKVSVKEGGVTIRYPRRLLGLGEKQGRAEIALSTAIPWQIAIQGGTAEVVAELGGLNLAGLEIKGGFSMIRLDLPAPSGVVPIQLTGGTPEITVRRPSGTAARVYLKGWVSELIFDEQTWSGMGNNARLQSPAFDPIAPCYDIEVTGYANKVAITTH